MASYHLSVKILSRSSGRSGVAAAAYRARSMMHDERQGLDFDYSKKEDLGHAEILAPDHAPAWMLDREQLWNGVELAEKRKDAQIVREVEVALPLELSREAQVELLRNFCRQNFVSQGMVADICVHRQKGNPHAHIMLTMREIEGEGFGKKVRAWNNKQNLLVWREEWANLQNLYLAKAGFDKQVDHRSYAAQGLDIEPQIKQGVPGYASSKYEFERADEYRRISFENGRRIIADPAIALDHLTRYQSTVTHDDILKYVHAHCDDSQFYEAVEAVTSSDELIRIEDNPYDRFSRYTTRSLQQIEGRMLAQARGLGKASNHRIKPKFIRQAKANSPLSKEQKRALDQVCGGGDLSAIVGHAGTGKSFTLRSVKEAFESAGYRLHGVALAGVAAEGLEISSGIRATTIQRKFFDWDNGRDRLNRRSVLVIDEAGMVGTRQMDRLLSEAKNAGAKALVVGDTKQTQAVEAGGAFRGIVERVEVSRLNEVWRQKVAWQKEATRLFSGNADSIHRAMDMYRDHGHVSEFDQYGQAATAMLDEYVRAFSPGATSVMTAHKNEDIERLNLLCREALKKNTDRLGAEQIGIRTSRGKRFFSVGDRVLFLRNEHSLGVKNGTFGTVEGIDTHGNLTVAISRYRKVAVNTQFYDDLTYGYAATVHKLQGATIDKTYFLASEGVDRHTGYVAMSRHRNDVHLYYSRDKFQNFEDLKRRLGNPGEKELLVDYEVDLGDASGVLDRLTATAATFTEDDIERIPNSLTHDVNLYRRMIPVGQGTDGKLRFTGTEMLAMENSLFASAMALAKSSRHALGRNDLQAIVSSAGMDESQRFVFNRIACGADLTLVDYQYGADRAYVARMVARAYRKQGYVVEGLSLSGMGAAGLQADTGIASMTIHKKIWEWGQGRNLLNEKSVLIVDNASMVGTRQADKILSQARKGGAKVILFGEERYLQPIAAGGAYRGLLERVPMARVSLSSSDRATSWQHEARDLLKSDRMDAALDLFAEHGAVCHVRNRVAERLVGDWLTDVLSAKTYKGRVMLAYTNRDVGRLNAIARKRLKELGYIDRPDTVIATAEKGELAFAAGDRIMFLRKDSDLGVQSGSPGTLRSVNNERLHVKLDSGENIVVDVRLYNDLTHGYASTVYRSAVLQADNTYILASKHFDRHTTAAALQCHIKQVRLYHKFVDHQALKSHLGRSADKDLATDYPLDRRAYRITVSTPDGKTHTKRVFLNPDINKERLKNRIGRIAREFAAEVAGRSKLSESQARAMGIKVERIATDRYRRIEKSRPEKGRGL